MALAPRADEVVVEEPDVELELVVVVEVVVVVELEASSWTQPLRRYLGISLIMKESSSGETKLVSGSYLDFVRSSTSTPRGAYVRRTKRTQRNRLDRHQAFAKRLPPRSVRKHDGELGQGLARRY